MGETVIPHQIDRSILKNKSGSDQSKLIAALKWFKLIDDEGHPSPELNKLADAGDSDFGPIFKPIILNAYTMLTDGSINVASGTSAQLEAKFREYGMNGSTLTKAIAFFLGAAREADIEISPHFKAPLRAKTNGTIRKRKKKNNGDEPSDPPPPPPATKQGMVSIPIAIPNNAHGEILLPNDLSEDEWDYVSGIISFMIDGYRKMSKSKRDIDKAELKEAE
jgi:hypothetical protein